MSSSKLLRRVIIIVISSKSLRHIDAKEFDKCARVGHELLLQLINQIISFCRRTEVRWPANSCTLSLSLFSHCLLLSLFLSLFISHSHAHSFRSIDLFDLKLSTTHPIHWVFGGNIPNGGEVAIEGDGYLTWWGSRWECGRDFGVTDFWVTGLVKLNHSSCAPLLRPALTG